MKRQIEIVFLFLFKMTKSSTALVKKEGTPASHLKVLYTGAAQGSALVQAAIR